MIYVILSVISFILILSIGPLFRARRKDLELKEKYQKIFSKQLDIVLKEDLLENEQDLVEFLVDTLFKDGATIGAMVALSDIVKSKSRGERIKKNNNYVRDEVAELLIIWTFAVSYRMFLPGRILRYYMRELLDEDNRKRWAQKQYKKALKQKAKSRPLSDGHATA